MSESTEERPTDHGDIENIINGALAEYWNVSSAPKDDSFNWKFELECCLFLAFNHIAAKILKKDGPDDKLPLFQTLRCFKNNDGIWVPLIEEIKSKNFPRLPIEECAYLMLRRVLVSPTGIRKRGRYEFNIQMRNPTEEDVKFVVSIWPKIWEIQNKTAGSPEEYSMIELPEAKEGAESELRKQIINGQKPRKEDETVLKSVWERLDNLIEGNHISFIDQQAAGKVLALPKSLARVWVAICKYLSAVFCNCTTPVRSYTKEQGFEIARESLQVLWDWLEYEEQREAARRERDW
ncbi:hypothetical protein BJ508DRAFT_321742 [Ascobolus immersus RN42]|uniref:Uncharacterized protein n=1 Tax=Ascobolus immersus RN42 TaxID=1160509 RepID=A0A3N4IQX4_ASCIM|nr:hypothetical protein BJ508DRAFT_321742 [Ascobolus immersus RN42]